MRNGQEVVQKVKAAGPENLVSYYFGQSLLFSLFLYRTFNNFHGD